MLIYKHDKFEQVLNCEVHSLNYHVAYTYSIKQYGYQLDCTYHYSQICYGIETYGIATKSNLNKIHRLQNKIIKVLFNKHDKDWLTPTNGLHRELKILKVADVHKLFTLRLFYQHQAHKLPVTYKDYFKFRSEIHSRATRNNMDLHIPKAKTNTVITPSK